MTPAEEIREAFFHRLDRPLLTEQLFDQVPDIAFFIKDHLGRYVAANNTLVKRCGQEDKDAIIGKTAEELFPAPLGGAYTKQDQLVLKTARSITGQLELHLYPDGHEGWCLTYKEPILDKDKMIIGVSGISRDLHSSLQHGDGLTTISKVLSYIREHIDQPLRLPDLAEMAGLSVYQLDQRIRALYQMSAGQCITRARIDAACHMLITTGKSISNIALESGYSDQSAFTRQFKQTTGLTPKAYRDRRRNS
ncbi:AraC family transcriptional regulator [Verrucomicrobiaceae bacterium R5-34]|uniref:AraC family transcriptional regulator n=1 Tax=Oceaniferula flava TaxID=2800421 RepID=A0AAE2S9I9_9BACT|nr:AraC family transcriptional regulator [Oceaniferula flavus]MBK1831538.1 AraC family transcriptional regulator [Verrucomicrobiaceae bacterium R5-34]MBK1854223.1 AraC family transcriptional regulator [Oceaniferula flavus]MBM1135529.1 AraC family transcriptional regulator [Oceaniferula flavus]